MIDQAKRTHPCEAEVLYWMLEDALTAGKSDRAISIYAMLAYLARYRKDIIAQALQPAYRQRLQEIAYELYGNGTILKKRQPIEIKPAIRPYKLPFADEKELQIFLRDHPQLLQDALQDSIDIKGTEVETDFDYRCDITAQSTKYFYPIELKVVRATHQVVSQINKYCWFFYRKLRYNWFREIQGVVCAAGWDAWSVNEIRREGHWCFTVVPDEKTTIRLKKV